MLDLGTFEEAQPAVDLVGNAGVEERTFEHAALCGQSVAERRQREVRRILIGRSDAGRFFTLVIEETIEPTTWLIVTGWSPLLRSV